MFIVFVVATIMTVLMCIDHIKRNVRDWARYKIVDKQVYTAVGISTAVIIAFFIPALVDMISDKSILITRIVVTEVIIGINTWLCFAGFKMWQYCDHNGVLMNRTHRSVIMAAIGALLLFIDVISLYFFWFN